MNESSLGKRYRNEEVIISQGDRTVCMYVILSGKVEVIRNNNGNDNKVLRMTVLEEGQFFGEVPLFERLGSANTARSTVRALGDVRVITVDRKTLLRRINENPSLAYRIMETMSRRIIELEEMASGHAIN